MKKAIKRIWDFFLLLQAVAIITLAALTIGAQLFGFQLYTVLSGSMVPAYEVGSVIYVKEVEIEELAVGDAITFSITPETVATHRIIDIVEDSGKIYYQTKGDANDEPDAGLVPEDNVVGKAVFTIPHMGYIVSYIKNPPGTYLVIGYAAFIFFQIILMELIFGEDEAKKKKEKKKEK